MVDFKKKRNLFHLLEWIGAMVAALMLAGLRCFYCGTYVFTNQFIDATIYGYLIMTTLVFMALCLEEDLPKKVGFAICGLGFILYLATGIILVLDIEGEDFSSIRTMIAVACCFFNAVVYAVEFFFAAFKKEE